MIKRCLRLSEEFLVKPGKIKLKDWDANYHANKKKQDVESELATFSSQMSELQYKLFAEGRQALVIILQGVDSSGKDGTIRHVMGALNPQSCYAKAFKVPTGELSHDYLWRVHIAIPAKGQIAIFNRSHYEDVIEAQVHNLIPKNDLTLRYRQFHLVYQL